MKIKKGKTILGSKENRAENKKVLFGNKTSNIKNKLSFKKFDVKSLSFKNLFLKKNEIDKTRAKKSIGKKIFGMTVGVTLLAVLVLLGTNIYIFKGILSDIENETLVKGRNIKGSISTSDVIYVKDNKITSTYEYKKLKEDLRNAKGNENINYAKIIIKFKDKLQVLVDAENNNNNFAKDLESNEGIEKAFNGEINLNKIEDKNGKTFINGYYPMKGSNGEIFGIVEVSNDISRIINVKNTVMIQNQILGVVLIIAYALVSFVLSKNIDKNVKIILSSILKMSEGDLSEDIRLSTKDEFGLISKYINELRRKISVMISSIVDMSINENKLIESLSESSSEMTEASKEVSANIHEIDTNLFDQIEDMKKVTDLLGSFDESINGVNNVVVETDILLNQVNNELNISNKALISLEDSKTDIQNASKYMNDKLNSLYGSLEKIKGIAIFIDEIADQTNLLALNASIEAARVGEAGRGFAVVANEIRSLAEEVKKSSLNIDKLLITLIKEGNDVRETSSVMDNKLVNQYKVIDSSISAFNDIVNKIYDVIPKMNIVNNKMEVVSKEKSNILLSIEKSQEVLEEISSSTIEINNFTSELNLMASEVEGIGKSLNLSVIEKNGEINKFKIVK